MRVRLNPQTSHPTAAKLPQPVFGIFYLFLNNVRQHYPNNDTPDFLFGAYIFYTDILNQLKFLRVSELTLMFLQCAYGK